MEQALDVFGRGGWAMWPLLVLSVLSLAVSLERLAFWLGARRSAGRLDAVSAALRAGDSERAARLATRAGSAYGRFVAAALSRRPPPAGDPTGAKFKSVLLEQAEIVRGEAERFHATHQSIITAAPMIGILGTVTGIIRSFNLLAGSGAIADPAEVAPGIAEALITTAAGLVVALLTLFPHAVFRAWSEGFLTRLEVLGAAAVAGVRGGEDRSEAKPEGRERSGVSENVS